jgi:hypothetical protein
MRFALIALLGLVVSTTLSAEPNKGGQKGHAASNQQQGNTDQTVLFINNEAAATGSSNDDAEKKAEFDRQIAEYTHNLADYTFWLAILTGFLGFIGIIQIAFLIRGDRVTKRSADAARDSANAARDAINESKLSAQREHRAYVGVVDYISSPHHEGAVLTAWQSQLVFRNDGNTPAKNVQTLIEPYVSNTQLDHTFEIPNGIAAFHSLTLLNPHSSVESSRVQFSIRDVNLARTGDKFLYLWGWIEYDDVFVGSKRHRTEFCRRVEVVRQTDNPNHHPFFYVNHMTYNAMDEDCKYQPSRTRNAVQQQPQTG